MRADLPVGVEDRHPAILNLRTCQRQLDADGCEVGVSRQAMDETLAIIEQLLAALKIASAALVAKNGDDLAPPAAMNAITDAIAKATGAQ